MSRPASDRRARAVVVLLAFAFTVAMVVVPSPPASAANADNFNAGYLISDAEFFNGDALTAADVYAFLKAKNPGCATGATCILNYSQAVKAMPADPMCKAVTAATGQSASQVIYKVGKACNVSQKALLVILQKEQGLVTDTSATSRQLNYAMGYGCPDTAPCDPAYAGLFIQIYKAAWALKRYTMPPGTGPGTGFPTDYGARYPVGSTSKILYNPKSSCGTKSVYVANQATHALYVYTPYTPNAAALAYLYSEVPDGVPGKACAAYGNRNFWRMYTDWFGPAGEIGMVSILNVYAAGDNETLLGAPIGTLVRDEANEGVYQEYANGYVTWTAKLGAHVLLTPFTTAWTAAGGAAGIGWPTADTVKTTASGGGMTQQFQRGMFAKATGKTTFTLSSTMRSAYNTLKGPAGVLGWPTAKATTTAAGTPAQQFQNATLFATAGKSGYVAPALRTAYLDLGDVTGALGWPKGSYTTSDVGGGGGYQAFDNGGIYASTDHGVHAVYGGFATRFSTYGGLAALGWPTANRAKDEDTGVLAQPFEGGTVFTDGTKYALMTDEFLAKARTVGFVTGSLGWPTGTRTVTEGGAFQVFSGGILTHQGEADIMHVFGGMRTVFENSGGVAGTLGWPTSNRYSDPAVGTIDQDFDNYTVFFKGARNGIVGTNFVALARTRGVATGALGWPTSRVLATSARGGGAVQNFVGGTITWQSTRGAFYMPVEIRKAHLAAGSIGGALGWPVAAPTWNASTKTKVQAFEGGTISWSAAKGAIVVLIPAS